MNRGTPHIALSITFPNTPTVALAKAWATGKARATDRPEKTALPLRIKDICFGRRLTQQAHHAITRRAEQLDGNQPTDEIEQQRDRQ